jgi:hypothetical protein
MDALCTEVGATGRRKREIFNTSLTMISKMECKILHLPWY